MARPARAPKARASVVYMPDEVWMELRYLALERRTSMSREVEQAVLRYLGEVRQKQGRAP